MRTLWAGLWLLLVSAPAAPAADAVVPAMEEALLQAAPKILKFCQDKGHRNIAVLKFQISLDGKDYRDDAGTMGLNFCERLEQALLMQIQSRPFGMIRDANEIAAELKVRTHLNEKHLPPLFAANYPLYWGLDRVQPDILLSGGLKADPTGAKLNLKLMGASKGAKWEEVLQLALRNQPENSRRSA